MDRSPVEIQPSSAPLAKQSQEQIGKSARGQRLSQSELWEIQRQFFTQQGPQAWNTGKVPHYATSNPFIASAYAEVVIGFLRDCLSQRQMQEEDPLVDTQPIYIFELGTGSGRFSYHFLQQLLNNAPPQLLVQVPIKYVMTDFAQQNIDFWQNHEALKPFVEQGILDFARFDIQADEQLSLIVSKTLLTPERLQHPSVLIANYFFDSLPQDLFFVKAGDLFETRVSVTSPETDSTLSQAEALEHLKISFEDYLITAEYYQNSAFNQVLEGYRQQLDETAVLLPVAGLEGLESLRKLTGDRLLLLTADKGYARADLLENRSKPNLTFHQGCFSLMVNYHAIAQYVTHQGGQAFTPSSLARSLTVCAFLFDPDGAEQHYTETRSAYESSILGKGPDDFFALKKAIEPNYSTLSLKHILAYIRFSGWDFNIFLGCWPTLMKLVETTPELWLNELESAIHQVWERYFFIGEDRNLAAHLAVLLHRMDRPEAAQTYIAYSRQHYPETDRLLEVLEADAQSINQSVDQLVDQSAKSLEDRANFLELPVNAASSDADVLSLHLSQLRQRLEAAVSDRLPSPAQFPALPELPTLARLAELFNLSSFDQNVLLLCVAAELEPNFQGLFAQAQGNSNKTYPTLALALSLFPSADWSVLSAQTPLRHWQLIQLEPGRVLTQCSIQIDRRILCYLLETSAMDEALAGAFKPLFSQRLQEALPPSYERCVEQLVTAWEYPDPAAGYAVLHLSGADGTAKQPLAIAACERLGLSITSVSAAVLPTVASELQQIQTIWEREALLTNSVLLVDCDGEYPSDPGRDTAISLLLDTLSTPVIISSNDKKPMLRRSVVTVDLPALTYAEQTNLWQMHLGDTAAMLNGEVHTLASQFNLSPTAIQTACHQLQASGPETSAEVSSRLWQLCRSQARPNLDDLAQRIETKATWEDLVLPDKQREILADIATHLQQRSRVYQEWGFASKGDRGLGTSALFYGESGTGKTMAAEVLANSCQLDLYRIDLSTVVSKYIGETEKNLRRIFDAAETGGAILLFDEADALFGKRSEVKDSRDRHANIEVSYLLQRMEAYQGLAILTSNLKTSMDQAFLRRLRFMMQFPFPTVAARAEIWQRSFPFQAPTHQLDYEKLGQLKVAGGNIRSIALNAAFLAAEDNLLVGMVHIYEAAQREYLKLEKLLTTEEVKDWDI